MPLFSLRGPSSRKGKAGDLGLSRSSVSKYARDGQRHLEKASLAKCVSASVVGSHLFLFSVFWEKLADMCQMGGTALVRERWVVCYVRVPVDKTVGLWDEVSSFSRISRYRRKPAPSSSSCFQTPSYPFLHFDLFKFIFIKYKTKQKTHTIFKQQLYV